MYSKSGYLPHSTSDPAKAGPPSPREKGLRLRRLISKTIIVLRQQISRLPGSGGG